MTLTVADLPDRIRQREIDHQLVLSQAAILTKRAVRKWLASRKYERKKQAQKQGRGE